MQRDYAWALLIACGVTEGMLKGTDETKLRPEQRGIRHGQNYRLAPEGLANLPDAFKEKLRLDGFDLTSPIIVTRSLAPIIDGLRFEQ
jgi:hypothetical protein